jgi:hypothetical protein
MKTIKYIITILLCLFLAVFSVSGAEYDKLAQSGCQFLSVVSDARAAAMGEAMTSLQTGSSALFFNPAGMANLQKTIDINASNNRWIADIVHNTFGLAFSPFQGNYGVFGISFQSVDYGEFYGTRVAANDDGYVDTGIFKINSWAAGFGYAKRLTDRFSVGGQVRLVKQELGDSVIPNFVTVVDSLGNSIPDTLERRVSNKLKPLAFDFGTQFHTGIKSLVFGMSVRNFSKEIKYVEEGFQLPLVFNLGISMDMMDLIDEDNKAEQSLYVSIDASHYRSHPEQVKVGIDYRIRNTLSLRGGYISNNYESKFSFGVGISYSGATFDYCYTPFGLFGSVQRMTVRFSL